MGAPTETSRWVDQLEIPKYNTIFNQNGDLTDNDRMTEKEYRAIECFQPFTLHEYKLRNYAEERISDLIQWCDRNQVKVMANWPSTVDFEEYRKPGAQALFQSIQNLDKTLKLPLLVILKSLMC